MATQSLIQHLNNLHSEKLFSSVEILSRFLMTVLRNGGDGFSAGNQYEILSQSADAEYEQKQYRTAESHYRQALAIRKNGLKQKGGAAEFSKLRSDIDVKYRIHQCCMALGNGNTAAVILESIPMKQRPAKINYALAKCYHKAGCLKSAISLYKEVLRKLPLAFDVIFELLALGENVNDIISTVSSTAQGSDWIIALIKAHASMQNKEYNRSFSQFDIINKKTSIAGDAQLQVYLGNLRVKSGHNRSAIFHFESARSIDSVLLDGMDVYAYLLFEENEHEKLDKLAGELFMQSDQHPAPWVALGYRALAKSDFKRAVYLAVQATNLDRLCVQAIVLKGCALRAIDEVKDAIVHFREAIRLDPNRFVCYKELVDTYLPREQINEAAVVAHSALKTIGSQSNCLVLCASVHMVETNGKDKALTYVNKALSLEPNNRYAIIVKGGVLFKHEKFTAAIKFLSTCVENHSSSLMHTLLGDCYQEVMNLSKAVDHYTIAISLNPDNKEASDGLNKISALREDASFAENDDVGQLGQDAEEGNSDSDVMYTE